MKLSVKFDEREELDGISQGRNIISSNFFAISYCDVCRPIIDSSMYLTFSFPCLLKVWSWPKADRAFMTSDQTISLVASCNRSKSMSPNLYCRRILDFIFGE
ncbi:peptide transporter family 1 like protein, partial [Danaus plexippus plexippus]